MEIIGGQRPHLHGGLLFSSRDQLPRVEAQKVASSLGPEGEGGAVDASRGVTGRTERPEGLGGGEKAMVGF